MADHRVVLIENPAHLSIDIGRLKISLQEQPARYLLPQDIAVVCLHHPAITLTQAVLQAIVKAGGVMVVTDQSHYPAGLLLPLLWSDTRCGRLFDQIKFAQDPRATDRVLQHIVCSRIMGESFNLRHFKRKGALYLDRLVNKVLPGDPANIEAQAAKHYWKHLFDEPFRRHKKGAEDGINSRLNFGYAVLRAMVARQIVVSGLNPVLGVGHCNQQNPWNLADDLMEPYRFVVEYQVKSLCPHPVAEGLSSEDKVALLGFVENTCTLADRDYRLGEAIARTVNSYCHHLKDQSVAVCFPQAVS